MVYVKRLIITVLTLVLSFGNVGFMVAASATVQLPPDASKEDIRQALKSGTNFFDLNTKVGPSLSDDAAKDSAKLQSLKNGDQVVLYSLWEGKYMQISAIPSDPTQKYLTPTGDDKTVQGCQFVVVRDSSNWITFQNPATGFILEANMEDLSHSRVCFNSGQVKDSGRWSLEVAANNVVRLQNKRTGGYFDVARGLIAATNSFKYSLAQGGIHSVMLIEPVEKVVPVVAAPVVLVTSKNSENDYSKEALSRAVKAKRYFFASKGTQKHVENSLPEDAAKDSAKLQSLKNGDRVALYSLWKGRYIQTSSSGGDIAKNLSPTGDNKTDQGCQFVVVRDSSNWITFQNPVTGFNLQVDPDDKMSRRLCFNSGQVKDSGRWSLEVAAHNVVRLQNKKTGGYLEIRKNIAGTNEDNYVPSSGGFSTAMLIEPIDQKQ